MLIGELFELQFELELELELEFEFDRSLWLLTR